MSRYLALVRESVQERSAINMAAYPPLPKNTVNNNKEEEEHNAAAELYK